MSDKACRSGDVQVSGRDAKGRFRPGESGNPRGKPRGTGWLDRLRKGIDGHYDDIVKQLVASAMSGDVAATEVILKRVCPPPKDEPVKIPWAVGDSSERKSGAILRAVAKGDLTPMQGTVCMGLIKAHCEIVEMAELRSEIEALKAER